jgi:predicted nuclease of restriction endonuclease-like RecB superfamily
MLPTELLLFRYNGEELVPKRLKHDKATLETARDIIALFEAHRGGRRGELDEQLGVLEGEATDYRVKRGLAHLLRSGFSTFETVSPLEPPLLRERTFALAARGLPSPQAARATVQRLSAVLSAELGREVHPEEITRGLYADLAENQLLTTFEPPEPKALVDRYNLSQVQGIFYRAKSVVINAHRNDPGEYKLLFRYLKLFGLMSYIEGDADVGFTITVDGPASLFGGSPRYGLALAKLLPALLHVTRWNLVADLVPRTLYDGTTTPARFTLESDCGLVSHYPPGKTYDSMVEASFASRWNAAKTEWQLEREVDLVSIPGSVMVPDFRLVHPDGRSYLLEIVGYWRPEYLKKKFAQVKKALRDDIILAVSEKLNLGQAGIKLDDVPAKIVWFKDKLIPKSVLSLLP